MAILNYTLFDLLLAFGRLIPKNAHALVFTRATNTSLVIPIPYKEGPSIDMNEEQAQISSQELKKSADFISRTEIYL